MDGWVSEWLLKPMLFKYNRPLPPPQQICPKRLAAVPVLWELSQAAEPLGPSVSLSVEWKHDSFLEGGREGWVL